MPGKLVCRSLASLLAAALGLPGAARAEDQWGGAWTEWFSPSKGRIGIEVLPMSAQLREYFGVDPDHGVLVSAVSAGEPAAEAGIVAGDVILAVDGHEIHGARELVREVRHAPEGKELGIELVRKGKRKEVEVVPRGAASAPPWETEPWMREGMRELRQHLRALERRLRELEERVRSQDPPRGTDET